MSNYAFHLQNSTTLQLDVGGTARAIAGVSDATVMLTQSVVELETGDSVLRQDSYKESVRPEAEITVRKWNHDLLNSILGSPAGSNAIEDTADIPPVSFNGTFEAADNPRTVTLNLVGGTTEEWPIFDLSMGDYGEWNLSLTFDNIETYTVNDP
jgi:hypothetical protein